MESTKRFVVRHFEPLIVLVLVAGTAFAVLFAVDKFAFLNFFYLPVLAAAYFLGKRQGAMVAAVAVLMVVVYAVIDPQVFMAPAQRSPGLALFMWGAFLFLSAYLVGNLYDARARAISDLEYAYDGILGLIATLIDAVDKHEQDHSVQVAGRAARMAVLLNLPTEEIDTVHAAGLLHEVSKVDVNLDTLRKAVQSGGAERPRRGREAIAGSPGRLGRVVDVVETYAEHYDGNGERRLRGEGIPLGARILAVAEEYESLMLRPPYGPGLSAAEALERVDALSGTRFDPTILPALKMVAEFEESQQG